jgi:hypothetical protein
MIRTSLLPPVLALSLACCLGSGCGTHEQPAAPSVEIIGTWAPDLREWLKVNDGAWTWSWLAEDDHGQAASGTARLRALGDRYHWRLAEPAAAALALARFRLTPQDSCWLPMQAPDLEALADMPPLPRLALDSAAYPDLVAMLRDLLTPLFGAVVVHWPAYPVPVRSPPAQSGEVDLAACLREAVAIWNAGEPEPWFVWQPDAAWGVRLAHFSGSLRQPPLMIQLTRLDPEHRPLVMRIVAGDNYASAASRPYAVRAFAHELGHALCLWGHSPDREHLLWGAAPPLRDDPSPDERRAARLLRLLPAGLDLNRYGCETDP